VFFVVERNGIIAEWRAMYPTEPRERAALQLCYTENHQFNRMSDLARKGCYEKWLPRLPNRLTGAELKRQNAWPMVTMISTDVSGKSACRDGITQLLSDANRALLRHRAEEVRAKAEQMKDPQTRNMMLKVAEAYDRLADLSQITRVSPSFGTPVNGAVWASQIVR
jgi:hypothetical protein